MITSSLQPQRLLRAIYRAHANTATTQSAARDAAAKNEIGNKAITTMHIAGSTAAYGAERRSTVSRNYRTMAALVVAGLALFGTQAGAENLLLKKSDGTTITQIPLLSSNGCTVLGNGDIEVRPQPIAGTGGDGWCPEGSPQLPTFPGPLAVSPLTLVAGGSVSATWNSDLATSCTGSVTRNGVGESLSGWTGTRALEQAAPGLSVTINTEGAYVFMITCANTAGQTTSQALTVNVSPVGPVGCESSPPDFGLVRQTSMINTTSLQGNLEHPTGALTVTSFNVIAGPWPARTQNGTIAVQTGKYVALAFNTGTVDSTTYGGTVSNPNRYGTITTITPAAFAGNVLLSFAKCPGVFETNKLPENNGTFCRIQATQGAWSWGVGVTDQFTCRLQPNTDYYLNIAYVDFSTGLNNCSGESLSGSNPTSCHWFGQPR